MAPEGFFDRQFKEQVEAGSFELNPFEKLALEHLQGRVLRRNPGTPINPAVLAVEIDGCPSLTPLPL